MEVSTIVLTIIQLIALIALATYLLVTKPSVKEVAGFVAGCAVALWAVVVFINLVS